ncbi:MAG: S41 family peptidase [Pseudomonadota bacterium]
MLLRKQIILSILLLLSCNAYAENASGNQVYYKKFQEVFERLEKEYVTEPDKQKMIDAALNGMLNSLDPHSTYFTPQEFEDMANYTKGEFGGIGVEIVYEGGVIKVISPIDDLPAEKAGIKAGDYIIAINGETVNSLGYNKAVKAMRGEPGTVVKVSVLREGENRAKDYELTRCIVKIKAVKYNLDGDIAYIRLVTFNEHATSELKKAMKTLISEAKKPIKGIILDMRNNPGGLLEQAVAISEYFIDSGVIVTTKGRTASSNSSFSASKFAAKAPDVPLVVLINEGSASSSEIVAGALQDYKRAVILGTQSFGKGSVQSLIRGRDSSGMKFTTSKYYTPQGRSIQAEGITPDIIAEQAKVEYPKALGEDKKFSEASLKNYLKNDDKPQKEDVKLSDKSKVEETVKDDIKKDAKAIEMSEMYHKDYQYSRAYDLILGLNLTGLQKK